MAKNIIVDATASKSEKYKELFPQIKALISHEDDLTANLANICAALKYGMDFFWVGFYLVKDEMLVLAPFQGTVACTRIPFGKGVCGTAYEEQKTIIVSDVNLFTGHIACSSDSQSEIVIPVLKDGKVLMVLDVDSDQLADFDEVDKIYLEQLAEWIADIYPKNLH